MDLVIEARMTTKKAMVVGIVIAIETVVSNEIEIRMILSMKRSLVALMRSLIEERADPKLMVKISLKNKESMVTKTHFNHQPLFQ